MNKNIFYISICILLVSAGMLNAQTSTSKKDTLIWYTELATVHEISKSSNKPIFGFFTGSDWCGWCHKLQKDVFAKKDFIEWANKNVILLELDFPKRKQLPTELAQQNSGLQQAFQVRGYPTVWLFFTSIDETTKNYNLTALGSLGYPQGAEPGKEEVKFLADANLILANMKKQ
jgi:thioredoxin-related protein